MSEQTEAMLFSAKEAAAFIGISRSLFYELNAEAKIPAAIRLGKRVLWRKEEMKEWICAGCPNRVEWEQSSMRLIG